MEFFESKLNYIHLNPVRAGILEKEEEYLNSSAGDMYGTREGKLLLSRLVYAVHRTYDKASELQIPKSEETIYQQKKGRLGMTAKNTIVSCVKSND